MRVNSYSKLTVDMCEHFVVSVCGPGIDWRMCLKNCLEKSKDNTLLSVGIIGVYWLMFF